jgi:hypothetical protein
VLCGGPGWRVVRAATDGAAVGDPARWPSARQVYRASGLCPATDASAGRRQDGAISREGSVTWRRAVRSLGGAVAAGPGRPRLRRFPAGPRQATGVIATAMAKRANRIAFAMVSDQPPLIRTGGGEPALPDPGRVARLVGWEAGSDTAGDVAGHRSRRGKLGARPPVIPPNPDQVS